MDCHPKKRLLWLAALTASLLPLGIGVLLFALPPLLETHLLPKLTKDLGLSPVSMKVRNIGLWGADLGPIQLDHGNTPLICIGAIHIDYSPTSLLRGEIPGITLRGAKVKTIVSEEGILLPEMVNRQPSKTGKTKEHLFPPAMKSFRIEHGSLELLLKGRKFIVNLEELTITPPKSPDGNLEALATISVLGNTVKVKAGANQRLNKGTLHLQCSDFVLQSLYSTGLLPQIPQIKARVSLRGATHFSLTPPKVSEAHLEAELLDSDLTVGNFAIENDSAPLKVVFTTEKIPEIKWSASGFRLKATKTQTWIGGIEGSLEPSPSGWTSMIKILDVNSDAEGVKLHFPNIELTAEAIPGDQPDDLRIQGALKTSSGKISAAQSELLIQRFSLELPIQWPFPQKGRRGYLKVGDIRWKKQSMGGIRGTLHQRGQGLSTALRHNSKLLPGLKLFINGEIGEKEAHLQIRVPNFRQDQEMDLGRFHQTAAGILVKGNLSAEGKLHLEQGTPIAKGELLLSDVALRDPERQLSLKGLRLQVDSDNLIKLETSPKQNLRIEEIEFGKLRADSLDADFQIEQGETLFIEKASVNWSKGKISTGPIRITPGVEDYASTLFCDRLNLAMVLDQLGVAEASGEGSVNGRVPVHYSGGKLHFDNGYLYSSPGESGIIKISETEGLLTGLPPGTPQHTQLDIATEALKDYTYKWAKLNISSEKEDLLLKLKLDGHPNRMLPFAYDKNLGQFKRIAGKGLADFKGISFEINFTSPLNQIIQYRNLLK